MSKNKKSLEEELAQISKTGKYDKVKSMIWTMIMPIIAAIISVVGIVCFFRDFKNNVQTLIGLTPLIGLLLFALIWAIIDFVKKRKHKNEENTRI